MTVREFISYLDKDKVANAKIAFKVYEYEKQKWFFYCDFKEHTYDEFMCQEFHPMDLTIDTLYDEVTCITDWEENGAKLLFTFHCFNKEKND